MHLSLFVDWLHEFGKALSERSSANSVILNFRRDQTDDNLPVPMRPSCSSQILSRVPVPKAKER